jgi:hypothetical protein
MKTMRAAPGQNEIHIEQLHKSYSQQPSAGESRREGGGPSGQGSRRCIPASGFLLKKWSLHILLWIAGLGVWQLLSHAYGSEILPGPIYTAKGGYELLTAAP